MNPIPTKSGDDNSRNWLVGNVRAVDSAFTKTEAIAARDKTAALERSGFYDVAFHPFKIYRFPSCWRAAPDLAADWLKFRIHAGRFDGLIVAGTDGHDDDPGGGYPNGFPDVDAPLAEADVADLVVPINTPQYWFWIDASGAPTLKSGYVGQAVVGNTGDPVGLGWATFPAPDATHLPIGWVDTQTDAADSLPYIRQYLRSDAFQGGGGGGGLVLCQVVTEHAEYLTCQPLTATGDGTYVPTGGPTINVAKPFALRGLTGSGIIAPYGTAVIFAMVSPTGGTGVFVGGSDVGYEDANVDARVAPSISSGMHWRGAYSGAVAYNYGDVVLYALVAASAGIYIWNSGTASTPSTAPVYPPSGSNWQLIAFTPLEVSYDDDTCTEQNRYVNTTPQL